MSTKTKVPARIVVPAKVVRIPSRVIRMGENGFYRQLAKRLGVSHNYLHRIMVRGDRKPSDKLARRMAQAMGISRDQLRVVLERGKRGKAA